MNGTMTIMLAVLAAEIVLLLFVLLTMSWLRNRAARRRDAEAVKALVARIKKGKTDREAAIEKFLVEGLGLSGDALQKTRVAMLRAELTLLQRFAGVYKKREADAAARFDGDVVAALEPYLTLQADLGGESIAVEAAPSADGYALDKLREENQRLSDELKITMETMSRMLNEYSTMFSGGVSGDVAPIAALVGTEAAAALNEAVVRQGGDAAAVAVGLPQDQLDGPDGRAPADGESQDESGEPSGTGDTPVAADSEVEVAGEVDTLIEAADMSSAPDDPTDAPSEEGASTETVAPELPEGSDQTAQEVDAVAEPDLSAVADLLDEQAVPSEPDDEPEELASVSAEAILENHEEAAEAPDLPASASDDMDVDLVAVELMEEAVELESADEGPVSSIPDVDDDAPLLPQQEVGNPDGPGEKGDELDGVSEMLEEGPAEVIEFEESSVVEALGPDDDLFDAADDDTVDRADGAAQDGDDEFVDQAEIDDLFDVDEEPVKGKSGA